MAEKKALMVDPAKCTGCRSCEMACSLYNEQKCSPALSRIRVTKFEKAGVSFPGICFHCSKPQCMSACPTGAIVRDKVTGAVVIDEEACVGCRQCLRSCPFGQISFHPEKEVAFKCHLCGGEAICTTFCDSGALMYVSVEEYMTSRRRQLHQRYSLEEAHDARV